MLSGPNLSKARRIIEALEKDITDRRGLKNEWWAIDEDIMAELKATWTAIIVKELEHD